MLRELEQERKGEALVGGALGDNFGRSRALTLAAEPGRKAFGHAGESRGKLPFDSHRAGEYQTVLRKAQTRAA